MNIKLKLKYDCCEAVNVTFTLIEWLVTVSVMKKVLRSNLANLHYKDKAVLERMISEIDNLHVKDSEVDNAELDN